MVNVTSVSHKSDFGHQLAVFRKRLWMIVLLFAVTMVVILVQALSAPPVYRATVRLQVIPMESEQVALYGQPPVGANVDLTAFVFREVVRSGSVAWRTIGQLGLSMNAEQLLRNISASQQNDFVTVTAEADSPQLAQAIVTAQVENALAQYRDDRMRPTSFVREFVEAQLAEAEQELAKTQATLESLELEHGFDSLERETAAYQDAIRNLRREQDATALVITQLRARIKVLEAEIKASEAAAQKAAEGSDERGLALRRASEQAAAVASLRGELAAQEALHLEYDTTIKRWETELTSLIALGNVYIRSNSAVPQAQSARDFLFNKVLEAQLKEQQARNVGYLRVVEPARRPDQPVPSRTLQIALVGGLLSLVVGAALALLFEVIESATKARPERA
ncbi:MAG: Wzz/FepE/Etk N-terminal domain-containing protein [Anaerolineae bacterium]|nr:Wzz/FepE/Etk N-terminal domain-containing protein [Anaerolineae bacterium]